jgi:hypothetical protein
MYTIIMGKDLRPAHFIIHNYKKFYVESCGFGIGGDDEFGDYVWVKGFYTSPYTHKSLADAFWTFGHCPIIQVVN